MSLVRSASDSDTPKDISNILIIDSIKKGNKEIINNIKDLLFITTNLNDYGYIANETNTDIFYDSKKKLHIKRNKSNFVVPITFNLSDCYIDFIKAYKIEHELEYTDFNRIDNSDKLITFWNKFYELFGNEPKKVKLLEYIKAKRSQMKSQNKSKKSAAKQDSAPAAATTAATSTSPTTTTPAASVIASSSKSSPKTKSTSPITTKTTTNQEAPASLISNGYYEIYADDHGNQQIKNVVIQIGKELYSYAIDKNSEQQDNIRQDLIGKFIEQIHKSSFESIAQGESLPSN